MGNRSKLLNYDAFMSLKIVFILANSANTNEIPHTFQLDLHYLPKYLFTDIRNKMNKSTSIIICSLKGTILWK